MSKTSEPATEKEMSHQLGSFAPAEAGTAAKKNASDASNGNSGGDLSPWKNRFMTALLDN